MNGFMTITIDDGEIEETVKVPSKFEVCPDCEGCGTDRGRSVECDGGGFTASEWAEQDDDFKADYLGGVYDRPCECCKGLRVIEVVDRDRADPAIVARLDAQAEIDAEDAAMRRAEMRMGC